MKDPGTLELPQTLLSIPEYDWECRGFKVNEGPAVLIRNNRIFVTYSASATDANYCMGLLHAEESSDLLDSSAWTKEASPVLTTNPGKGMYGPGHNSFTTSEDGSRDILVYHARTYEQVTAPLYDPNRHTWISEISYDDRGFPMFQA